MTEQNITKLSPKFKNRISDRYGMLTVLSYHGKIKGTHCWLCVCDCGTQKIVRGNNLASGNTSSCGCQEKRARDEWRETQKIKSPHSQKLQTMYDNMRKRCYLISNKSYHDYGGRGITICDEWLNDRWKFYDWAISRGIEAHLTLDRINNDLGYSPENCRLVDAAAQNNNRRSNIMLEHDNKKMNVTQWAKELGVSQFTLFRRIDAGWSVSDILTRPVKK